MRLIQEIIRELISVSKKLFLLPLNLMIESKNNNFAMFGANLKYKFKGLNLHISFDATDKLYFIEDNEQYHWFGNLARGASLYHNGLSERNHRLFNSYFLEQIEFKKDDVVIDCGANYADLWLGLKEKINENCYITFEPGALEYASIIRNAPNGIHNRLGLSNANGVSKFYLNEKYADSSLIEPNHFTHIDNIQTTTLSHYIKTNGIKKIKLFKLEAEGFEPEILEGALEVLSLIDFIAIDGGYERGKEQNETFSYLCNSLYEANFEILSINFVQKRALFQKK